MQKFYESHIPRNSLTGIPGGPDRQTNRHSTTSIKMMPMTYKISVKDPVGMNIMNAVENLVQKWLHHSLWNVHHFLVGFCRSVELDDMLKLQQDKTRLYCNVVLIHTTTQSYSQSNFLAQQPNNIFHTVQQCWHLFKWLFLINKHVKTHLRIQFQIRLDIQ